MVMYGSRVGLGSLVGREPTVAGRLSLPIGWLCGPLAGFFRNHTHQIGDVEQAGRARWASITGNSLILRSAMMATASVNIEP